AAIREDIIGLLISWGYAVQWSILDTKGQGIPQSRPRVYMVAIDTRFVRSRPFLFPDNIEPEPLVNLLDNSRCIREPPCDTANAKKCLEKALRKFEAMRVDPRKVPCCVDTGASPNWSSAMVGCSPCLTASRHHGHYVTTKGGMMTLNEMCRLQGVPPDRFDHEVAGVSAEAFARALGNAMSVNVLQRLLAKVLYSARLVDDEIPLPTTFSGNLR
ncbi:MAG: hypothetical protein GY772_08010, partial [bacterium]|nr:hypothetical protein [bacterium]